MRQRLAHWLKGTPSERFYALRDISFRLAEGEGLAVIGPNGAGKSTLLGLVAGLAKPDAGTVAVEGRIAALLELGSGFHPDLTGGENIRVNASLLGLSRRRTAELYDEIVDFADVGDFINEPLRTYSTGMIMRLAFSVAVKTEPSILIVDEVLAVGDSAFQAKCFDWIRQFRRAGKTLICVSHASGLVQEICDRAIWLDHGQLMMNGQVKEVVAAYAGSRSITMA